MNRTIVAMSLLALLAAAALQGCGSGPSVTARPTSGAGPTSTAIPSAGVAVTVTLGIYSGRPDPTWVLAAAQAAEVVAAIERLPGATGVPPEGGLGYHGFTLVMHRTGQADQTLVAYRATIAAPGVGPRRYRIDTGRTVERLLLDVGRPALVPAEIAIVEADLIAAP